MLVRQMQRGAGAVALRTWNIRFLGIRRSLDAGRGCRNWQTLPEQRTNPDSNKQKHANSLHLPYISLSIERRKGYTHWRRAQTRCHMGRAPSPQGLDRVFCPAASSRGGSAPCRADCTRIAATAVAATNVISHFGRRGQVSLKDDLVSILRT